MSDTEIYVDGIATMQIKNMNDWLNAIRLQIIQQKNPDAGVLYLKVLESSHIQEEESVPIERPMSNDKKVQRFFCDEMQIPFDHLSVDEHKAIKDVFKRSKLLKALPNRQNGK